MAQKAFVTPEVLKWARESAKISPEAAAGKLKVVPERIYEWENGESYPTIRQAKILAKTYRRPFALLFLPKIPKDFYPLQDFRRSGSAPLSTASVFIIREIQEKQAWMRDFLEESGAEKLPFAGRFTITDPPEKVAEDILSALHISPGDYSVDPLKDWIAAAESAGIFVARTSFIHSHLTIDPTELQGFAISDDYAPFVFINSKDWKAAQIFTLVHELAHIWIAESGTSNNIDEIMKERDQFHPVELFCNEVAANVLMPKSAMIRLAEKDIRNPQKVFTYYKSLGVSTLALIYRLKNLNLISEKEFKGLKLRADQGFHEYQIREKERKKKTKDGGGPDYYLLRLYRNGRLFTQTVLDSFKSGEIGPSQASNLLEVKSNKFHKLEAHY